MNHLVERYYRRRPIVESSLKTAVALLSERFGVCSRKFKPALLLRKRDSLLFRVFCTHEKAPFGFAIKIPATDERASRWKVRFEADRLAWINEFAIHPNEYFPIIPLAISEFPPCLIMPFFPSRSLRDLLLHAASDAKQAPHAINCAKLAGNWLAKFYNSTAQTIHEIPRELYPSQDDIEKLLEEPSFTSRVRENIIRQLEPLNNKQFIQTGLTLPRESHGDFHPDNVLAGADNRISIIDPEIRTLSPFREFSMFRMYLALFSFRVAPARRRVFTNAAIAFNQAFEQSYPNTDLIARVYLLYVTRRILNRAINRVPRGIKPAHLIRWIDRYRLNNYWLTWLKDVPDDRGALWPFMRDIL